MATLNRRPSEPESSVTLTRNAKGIVQFEVTIRSAVADVAFDIAKAMFDELAGTYPYPTENGAT
jgi:hypothetical protein